MTERRLRILVLSWHYPTSAAPLRGLWVERMVDAAAAAADVRVIVPTPWVPPLVPMRSLSRYRHIPQREMRGGVEIHYPRVLGSVEHFTDGIDARLSLPSVLALARRLHHAAPFDLIHAHFVYPEGVVASAIARALGIPVVTSEHALWTPWLVDRARIGRQVEAALPQIRLVTAVSGFLREDIDGFAKGRVKTQVLPNVLDDTIFTAAARSRDPHELLYVGMIRRVKRVDVLLRALAEARHVLPALHLRILSSNVYRTYARDVREIHELVRTLGLEGAVRFEAGVEPPAVAEAMRRCGFVVVSSTRRETFCSVAAESLACGTPLVLTRCGGPEEFVTTEDGVLVAPDDPAAFAEGILEAMRRRDTFQAEGMRGRIVARFGRAAWRERAMAMYEAMAGVGS
ncbi:MAG TPA: glycosyltransferase [Gemmatimonadaceae bacterium]|nr:glycosyltransferase [Gemmatimonadaceae bacterium]